MNNVNVSVGFQSSKHAVGQHTQPSYLYRCVDDWAGISYPHVPMNECMGYAIQLQVSGTMRLFSGKDLRVVREILEPLISEVESTTHQHRRRRQTRS